MTAKEYLSQVKQVKDQIRSKNLRLDVLRERICDVMSPGFEEHYNASRKTTSIFEETYTRIDLLVREIAADEELLEKLKKQIYPLIDRMVDLNEAQVIENHYIKGMTLQMIAEKMYVTDRTVRRWHRCALADFEVPENPINIHSTIHEQPSTGSQMKNSKIVRLMSY